MANTNALIDTNTLLYYHQGIKTLLGNKVDKKEGFSLLSDKEIIRLSSVVNYDDTTVQGAIATMQSQIETLESGTYDDTELKEEIARTYATIASLADYAKTSTLSTVATSGSYADLSNKPTSLPASDVSAWAKATTKPTYTASEVGADTSGSADAALASAKTYTDGIKSEIDAKLTGGMHYKGSVNTYADLPTNASVGDFWNIKTASENNKAGDNAAWTGIEWDITAGTIDLTGYFSTSDLATNADIDTILNS